MNPVRVAVLGSSGFIGSSAMAALRASGIEPTPLPRISVARIRVNENLGAAVAEWMGAFASEAADLVEQARSADIVINAAGAALPDSNDWKILWRANVLLPMILAWAVEQADATRLIHISSAAVQGRSPTLDESPRTSPFSAYSRSKSLAEVSLMATPLARMGRLVLYRPTSVHGTSRPETRRLRKFANSRLATQFGDGSVSLPLATTENVGRAMAHLATSGPIGPIVLHPDEGWTQARLYSYLADTPVRVLPAWVPWILRPIIELGVRLPPLAGASRRAELLLRGQEVQALTLAADGFELKESVLGASSSSDPTSPIPR